MGKKIKIIVVGLPLFAERLTKDLSDFEPSWKFVHLDTYYNKWDKLKALWQVPSADAVFSINGSATKSGIFDLALKNRVPVIMNWVGTDVLKAFQAKQEGNFKENYVTDCIHLCEVSWIADELKEVGIHAEILNFASFDTIFPESLVPEAPFTVLSYISSNRAKFYGIDTLLRLAKANPEIRFEIVGTDAMDYSPLPQNLTAHGWVKEMDLYFERAHACIRFPEHDGLSNFVLEALARGKHVLYKYPFNYCLHSPTESELDSNLKDLFSNFKEGKYTINKEGKTFIEQYFNRKVILSNLIKKLKSIREK
jgi:hypothetical protein